MRIDSPRAISDAVAAAMECGSLTLTEADLPAAFFDLKSGLARELFQKFVNYRVPLALIVKDPALHGERFRELAREHRTHPLIRILPDPQTAVKWLAEMQRIENSRSV